MLREALVTVMPQETATPNRNLGMQASTNVSCFYFSAGLSPVCHLSHQ